jgi:rare lipoprotein A
LAEAGRSLAVVAVLAAMAALLAGCAGGPAKSSGGGGGGSILARPGRDGADANPPPNLQQVPDAEPRVEAIRPGGTNKPYVVLGRGYTPLPAASPYRESGLASWYGRKFHGASTSSGEPYDMYAMTAAHATLPIPSYVRVRNPANGREIIVRVNDRGPFHDGRIIDLSYVAAYKLDLLRGVAPVEVERITPVQIASGDWRRGNIGGAPVLAAASPLPPPAPAPLSRPAPAVVQVPASSVAMTVYMPPPPDTGLPPDFVAIPLTASSRSADQDQAEPPPPRDVVVTTLPAIPPAATADETPATGSFWVQLGAFGRPEGAAALQRRASGAAEGTVTVTVLQDGALNRVQAGPFASRETARDASLRLGESLQLAPVIVERR